MQSQGGEQQFGMILMMQTREMLVQGYALDALFRHEKMTLTDEDIALAVDIADDAFGVVEKRHPELKG